MDNSISPILQIILAALPAVIAAGVSIWVAWRSHRTTIRIHEDDIKSRENEKLVADAKRKLEAFYYPYLLIAKENTSLYSVFVKSYRDNKPDFRTLIALLEDDRKDGNGQFPENENDKAILDTIIKNDIQLKNLINSNAHVIEDKDLREDLNKAATHYAIIELAYQGKIKGEIDRFREFVHPNDVYLKVEKKAQELEKVIQNASK